MPNYRPTNTGYQTRGRLNRFFEPTSMAIVMGVFMSSLLVTFVVGFVAHYNLWGSITICFLVPNGASLYTVLCLIQGKPKGHLRDTYRTFILGHTTATAWRDNLPKLEL